MVFVDYGSCRLEPNYETVFGLYLYACISTGFFLPVLRANADFFVRKLKNKSKKNRLFEAGFLKIF